MFTIPIELPSGKQIRVPELKNRHYFCILKYCTNNDIEGVCEYFTSLLYNEFNIEKGLDYIDLIYTLIYIRMVFIDSNIIINNSNKREVTIGLETILKKIDDINRPKSKVIKLNQFKIEVGMPNSLYFHKIDDLVISSIKTVALPKTEIVFDTLNKADKIAIINKLPGKLYNQILDYVKQLMRDLGSITLIEQNKTFQVDCVEIDVFSNQLFYFVKSLYSQDLKSFFELMYHYNNKVVHDASMFMDLSPVDANIILNFFKKEIEDKNKELKNNQ